MPSLASGIADQGQRGFPETDARMSQMSCDLLRVEAVEECNPTQGMCQCARETTQSVHNGFQF